MAFARRDFTLALLAVLATSTLLIAGNGMEPRWPLMWIVFLPVLLFAATAKSRISAAAVTAASMLLGSYPMLRYLHGSLHLPLIAWLVPFGLASLLLAANTLLFRALLRRGSLWSAAFAFPSFWVVIEYFASFVPANGTAGSLAYTQLRFLPILQLASLTGLWGITFLLLLFQSTLVVAVFTWRTQPRRALTLLLTTCALLTAALLFGTVRLTSQPASSNIGVGLLVTDAIDIAAPGAPADQLLRDYASHAEDLARRRAQIVVMPEKVAVLLNADAPHADALLQSVADSTGATLVIGLLHIDPPSRFNQARIYTPHLAPATYNKQRMLPPFESDLTPGTSLALLQQGTIGVAICKDMDFIRPARDYGRAGIALLLDPAWDFKVDSTWHGHIAIMRGVENGYAIAHASKDGFLTVTDSRGRILGEVQSGSAPFASLLVNVPMQHSNTLFSRFGAWFPWLAAALLAIATTRLRSPPTTPLP
jgi:apolipoprotein N-acyltransferase